VRMKRLGLWFSGLASGIGGVLFFGVELGSGLYDLMIRCLKKVMRWEAG
jgi:hypothetical protein